MLDLLHKHFRSYLALSANLSALSRIVLTLLSANLTLCHMLIPSPFSSQLTTYNTTSILTVVPQFYTWIVLGAVDLHFSHTLVRKAKAVEKETR